MIASEQLLDLVCRQTCQIAMLVFLAFALTKTIARTRQHLAYILWLLVLLKCLTPPLLTSHFGVFCWISREEASSTGQAAQSPIELPSRSETLATDTSPTDSTELDARLFPLQPSVPSSMIVAPTRSTTWLLYIWYAGIGIASLIAVLQTLRFVRRIATPSSCDPKPLRAMINGLCSRLSVRRNVRLRITTSRVGPAVYGLIRPTIVLPELLVANTTLKELEPIIAHELLHIRRGDLWVNLVQATSKAIWWFNPLVWITATNICQSVESCCDEQTVACLGCHPQTYARSLVRVLELKQQLYSTRSFPGVRPVEITSQRLERIMNLEQGCYKHTPYWCWIVLAVLTLIVLPGASPMLAEDNPETPPEPVIVESAQSIPVEENNTTKEASTAISESPEQWNLSLHECMTTSLSNSKYLRKWVSVTQSSPPNRTLLTKERTDVSFIDTEKRVVELVDSVVRAYWELTFFKENLDTSIVARDDAKRFWQNLEKEKRDKSNIASAMEQYYFFRDRADQAERDLEKSENRVRYLMGCAPTDDRSIHPTEKADRKQPNLDWKQLLEEALAYSHELKRAKWRVKSRELELKAATEAIAKKVDAEVLLRSPDFELPERELRLGTEIELPLEVRRELTQIRNAQLAVAREKTRAEDMELETTHQLINAVQDCEADYKSLTTNFNRVRAAKKQQDACRKALEAGTTTIDLVLESDRRFSEAETNYAMQTVHFMLSRSKLRRLTGTLLQTHSVELVAADADPPR